MTAGTVGADVPLTSTGIPIRNLWYMLLYAWDELRLVGRWKAEVESSPTLDALLATILASLVRQRLRIGPARDYRDVEAEIPGVRGRIDFDASLKRLAFQRGRAHCRFQVYSPDTVAHRIIRSVVGSLVRQGDFGVEKTKAASLRQDLRRLHRDLDFADDISLTTALVRREQAKRHDRDYRTMLAICGLMVERQMPTERAGASAVHQLNRDAMTLWRVFEKFVANFYRARLTGWRVSVQPTWHWPTEEPHPLMPTMRPDLVLEEVATGRMIVLDTKFTASSVVAGQFGNATFHRDHVFQMYAYLRSQEHRSQAHAQVTGILLYPTAKYGASETVTIQNHELRLRFVDLTMTWEQIESTLRETVN